MGKFNAAKMSGAEDVAFQNNYNYLIDLLDSGYMTEAIVNGHRIRIDLNSQIGLNGTNDNVQMFGLDPNTGNFFLKSTLLSGDIVVGGSGDIGSIKVLDETDTPIITMDENGINVVGLVKAYGFFDSRTQGASVYAQTASGVGHVTAEYGDYQLVIFHFWHEYWNKSDGDLYGDFPTDGFFHLRHQDYSGALLSELTFGHDGTLANPYIASSVVFRAPTPVGATDVANKAYVDSRYATVDITLPSNGNDTSITLPSGFTIDNCFIQEIVISFSGSKYQMLAGGYGAAMCPNLYKILTSTFYGSSAKVILQKYA